MSSGFTPNNAPANSPDFSVLPPSVRAAAERSEALSKSLREPAPQPSQQEAQPAPQPSPQPQPQPTQQPAPQPSQQAPRQTQQPATTQEPGEDWEQRYRSLQGQFTVLNREVRDLTSERAQLLARVEELEAQQSTSQPSGDQSFNLDNVLSAEERSDWGEDWVSVMSKTLEAATAPLHAKIAKLEGQTTTMVRNDAKSARDTMHSTLDRDVPDWVVINEAPDFLAWVNKIDEASGKPRHMLLKEAYEKNQTDRVKFFFTSFLRDVRGASPEAQRGQDNGGQGRAAAPKPNDLTQFAAPGRGKSAQPQTQSAGEEQPPTITRQEITAFYVDKARGQLKITDEEAVQFEKDIARAQREGRIV